MSKANITKDNLMLQLNFTSGNESLRISSIYLTAFGSGDDVVGISYAMVCLDEDGDGKCGFGEDLLAFGKYKKDNGLLVFNLQNFVLPANSSEILSFYYKMSNFAGSEQMENYSFEVFLIDAYGVASGKKAKVMGLPIKSAVKTVYPEVHVTTTFTTLQTTTTFTTLQTTTTQEAKIFEGKSDGFIFMAMGFVIITIVIIFYFLMKTQLKNQKF